MVIKLDEYGQFIFDLIEVIRINKYYTVKEEFGCNKIYVFKDFKVKWYNGEGQSFEVINKNGDIIKVSVPNKEMESHFIVLIELLSKLWNDKDNQKVKYTSDFMIEFLGE